MASSCSHRILLILHLLLWDRIRLRQLLVAGEVDLCPLEHGLIMRQLRHRLVELRLIDVALDAEELRSLRDCGAVLIIDGFQIALDARDQIARF